MSLNIIDLGHCSYENSLEYQENTHSKVLERKLNDSIIFVEHDPVYTLGNNANKNNILSNYPKEIEIYNIDRGGDVTYHGPGQLVGYPIINIKKMNMSVSRYVHTLEEILINSLRTFDIDAQKQDKLIGVWVADEKIAAIGVRVQNGVTKHGFALNVNTELAYYNGIIPCGIDDCKVTSMEQLLNKDIELKLVQDIIIKEFEKYFN